MFPLRVICDVATLVAPNSLVLALNVNAALLSGWRDCDPDADMNSKKHVVSAASLTDWIVCGTIAADPLNDTPPIVRGVVSVAALPLVD